MSSVTAQSAKNLRNVLQFGKRECAPLLERELWFLILASLAIVIVAYQAPFRFELPLASPLGTPIDLPFVRGFYLGEHGQDGTYRWTRGRGALTLDGIGSGVPLRLTFRALAWRPPNKDAAHISVTMDGQELATYPGASDWKDYVVQIPAERNPDRLKLTLNSTTFRSKVDARKLGIAVGGFQIESPAVWAPTIPSPAQTLLVTLIAVGLYAVARQLRIGPRRAFWIALACLLLPAALIAVARPFYTAFAPNIIWLVALNYALALCAPFIAGGLFKRAGVQLSPQEAQWLWLLFLVGFNLRWIAELYPTANFGDSLFHLHRLDAVAAGEIVFSSSSGAIGFEQTIPYPPGLYLLLTPFTMLLQNHIALLGTFVSLIDSLAALLIYLMVRKATDRPRAAWLAMALDLLLPIAVLNFAWAIYANLFAQAAFLLALTLWIFQSRHSTRSLNIFLGFTFFVMSLSHVTAPMVLIGLYYSQFIPSIVEGTSNIMTARGARGDVGTALATVGGGVKYPSVGLVRVQVYSVPQWIEEGAKGLGREAWVYFALWTLVLAPFGYFLLQRTPRGRVLATLGWAGLAVGIFFALVGVILDVYVRYPLFLLPFVAMGSGVVLDALFRRGRLWALAACGLLALTAINSLLLWKFLL
ncbi:MAG: hypothetical protein HY741_06925 [Chloroflexi bacterium]|nr:hypothetical protein [Chloroflexota bacterium]